MSESPKNCSRARISKYLKSFKISKYVKDDF